MNQTLYPLLWMLGTVLLYAALRLLIVQVIEAARCRAPAMLLGTIVSLAPAAIVAVQVQSARPVRYFAVVAAAVIGLALAQIVIERTVMDWRRVKQRKEYGRKVSLHLVLLTGSVIFTVPFAWLLTTSLKEEDEIFKYPPVWLPTRQVEVMVDGEPRGVSTWKTESGNVKVAEIAELEDGGKRIEVLPPQPRAGETAVVARSELTRVRRFALKWDNYSDALEYLPVETRKGLIYVWNTIYITILSILGTIMSSSLVAYSFARLKWPGRDQLFVVLLATMMLPGAVTMIPVFLIFRALGWIDTLRPLWLPSFFGGAFSVFLLRQFFMTIPNDLEDAAKIDGCSYFGIYWRIMLPLIKPALAALTIMTFMGSWNNFMGPLIYVNSPEKMPLAYALQLFQGAHGAEYGLLMAASTLVMLPVLLVFFFTQRYFIQGITLTGIKG